MKTETQSIDDRRFAQARGQVLRAWLALLVLLALSATCAHLHLGAANLVVSLAIALVKIAIVGWVFMQMRERRTALPRLVAAASVFALMLLGTLSLADLLVRRDEPSDWQKPQMLPPASSVGAAVATPQPARLASKARATRATGGRPSAAEI